VPACRVGLLALGACLDAPPGSPRLAPAARHRAVIESAVLAERLGFDAVWLADAPGCAEHAPPTPAVVLAAIAARTERVRLGACSVVRAGLDPLRLAEDTATLDALSGGRLEVGAGLLEATGTGRERTELHEPEREAAERTGEGVELLRRLWTETEVSWTGRFRAPLERVTVEPRPVQQPHPPLWIAGGSAQAADLAARLGLPLLLPSAPAPPERLAPLVERYRERAARAGHRARVGACSAVGLAGPSPEGRTELADRLLAARAVLGLELQLLAFDPGAVPEPGLGEALERLASELLPRLAAPGAVG
jgi:alkanesulfonate monooxygenase SsuD/methylene tetrahydromethanopterin reductase-like flavin-dependent oxidoreductase (luciferase family)